MKSSLSGGIFLFNIYVFIDPLSTTYLKINKKFSKKKSFHFLNIVNIKTISCELFNKLGKKPTIEERNQTSELAYSLAFNFKAMQMQGSKKACEFLKNIQEEIFINNKKYSTTLLNKVAKKINADLEFFKKSRRSEIIKPLFDKDQLIAQNMKIKTLPSMVLFDSNRSEVGFVIDNFIPEILDIIDNQKFDSLYKLFYLLNEKYSIYLESGFSSLLSNN